MKTGFEKAKRTVWQCGGLLLAAWLLPSAIALGQTQPPAMPEPAPIRPFKMHVPDRVLIDLRRRLAEANWPDQLRARHGSTAPTSRRFGNSRTIGRTATTGVRKKRRSISLTSSQRKLMDSRFILSISALLVPTPYR